MRVSRYHFSSTTGDRRTLVFGLIPSDIKPLHRSFFVVYVFHESTSDVGIIIVIGRSDQEEFTRLSGNLFMFDVFPETKPPHHRVSRKILNQSPVFYLTHFNRYYSPSLTGPFHVGLRGRRVHFRNTGILVIQTLTSRFTEGH